MIEMTTKPVLEPAAQEFADATANPPYLFDLGPDKGRETVDEVQSGVKSRDRTWTSPTSPSRAAHRARCRCGFCARGARPDHCR